MKPVRESVKISASPSVMPMECSNWADRLLSRVTAVQPSLRILVSDRPAFRLGWVAPNHLIEDDVPGTVREARCSLRAGDGHHTGAAAAAVGAGTMPSRGEGRRQQALAWDSDAKRQVL